MTAAVQHLDSTRFRLWFKPRLSHGAWLNDLMGVVRKTVRDELRAGRDQNSFAAASHWLTQTETQAYLKVSRTTLFERRTARRLAKTLHDEEQAFAPEYGRGTGLRFRREELDAWMARQRCK